ncbi:alpha/beta hydrolase fold domain-containing protein [Variovorax boronicumulans]|uniref:alpha/beta hydrolase fold domain-containing protein n=1 Tax=Variovorax boronicumulans TaxID=436515 RepID=UPI001C56FB96
MENDAPELNGQLRDALALSRALVAAYGGPEKGLEGARRSAEWARAHWNEGGPQMNTASEVCIPVPGGDVQAVIYRPDAGLPLRPGFVFLHGGGFKTGSHWANDRQMREIAQAWGGIVVSANYLHAPEHVFPAAVNQTAALLRTLHARGSEWGIDGQQLACGGNSAGASVSFGAAVDLGRVPWLRAAVGIVGAFSADTSTESMLRYGNVGLFPDLASVPSIFDDYLPAEADRNDPRANLLLADPRLLPTTFLAAAEFDVFRDASAALARRLASAARLHRLKVYPGMSHLFFGFSATVAVAKECVDDIGDFLRETLPISQNDECRQRAAGLPHLPGDSIAKPMTDN